MVLSTGKIYTITLDEEKAYERDFMRLSSFLVTKDDFEWKILLRPMNSFSDEEMVKIGVEKKSTSEWVHSFILPTENSISNQLVYQACYKKHADIFNLIEKDIALSLITK